MNTLSVTVRFRPIRIGWCVCAGDFAAMRKAMKLSFTMWGGCYNPIIPVDDFATASSLVRLFRVDVLWPVSDDETVKEFIKQFPYLPNPLLLDELFVQQSNGEHSPQILDIYHPILRLDEERFKNNPAPDTTATILEWQKDDPLTDVLLATFGAVPTEGEIGIDYIGMLKHRLSATTVVLTPEEPLPQLAGNTWSVSAFSRAFMHQHHSIRNHYGHPGIYVGNASDFDDLVAFWNLRARDVPVMFHDPNQTARFSPALTNWLDILRSRPEGRFRSENLIGIWYRESSPLPDVSAFGNGLGLCVTGEDGIWHHVKAPLMYFSEGSVLAAIGEDSSGLPYLSFQLPQKPFEEEAGLYNQHLVVSIDTGIGLLDNERATLQIPYIPELNEYYGRQFHFEWDKARVEPDGMGIICDASRSDLSVSSLDVVDLVKQIFAVAQIDAQPSKPGRIAAQLINQMGGLQKCRVFKIAGVRNLIEKYRPDESFTRSGAKQTIRAMDAGTGVASFDLYENIRIEPRPLGSKLSIDSVLTLLLKKGIFCAGLKLNCPRCSLDFWTSLDDVRTESSCEYCGHKFNITPYLKDRDWAFRRSGLFGKNDHQEGAIPVVLTLLQLHTTFHSRNILYAPAMSLESKSKTISKCETDFVALIQRPLNGKIDIAIGECKTRKQISDDDVNNLQAIAEAFPRDRFNVYIIFSKLCSFSLEELARVRRLNNEHQRRVILFTDRELEPYRLYEKTAPYAVNFEDMARITEQVFLQSSATN